jgi:hypothetical protein
MRKDSKQKRVKEKGATKVGGFKGTLSREKFVKRVKEKGATKVSAVKWTLLREKFIKRTGMLCGTLCLQHGQLCVFNLFYRPMKKLFHVYVGTIRVCGIK